MGKCTVQFETEYNIGDVVLFRDKRNQIVAGIIEGYYCDSGAGYTFWFNIRITEDFVYSYSNGGDIGECDIICKLDGKVAKSVHDAIMNESDKEENL